MRTVAHHRLRPKLTTNVGINYKICHIAFLRDSLEEFPFRPVMLPLLAPESASDREMRVQVRVRALSERCPEQFGGSLTTFRTVLD